MAEWALRDYGTQPTVWDGDPNCQHMWGQPKESGGCRSNDNRYTSTLTSPAISRRDNWQQSSFCLKCGAWKGELGLETTFDLYIKHLCDIFDEIKRVLKKTGTCWVNIGDTYAGSGGAEGDWTKGRGADAKRKQQKQNYPSKSLCLIPFRFAIEMCNRGWILRNVIIWHKTNCMPSSARDRFTVDFDYICFFVKNRKYYFEQQLEPYNGPMNRWGGQTTKNLTGKQKDYLDMQKIGSTSSMREGGNLRPNALGRNLRCIWQIPTQGWRDSHYAVFAEKLVEIPIKAGCPEQVCRKCGRPNEKILATQPLFNKWDDDYWWKFLHGTSHKNRLYKQTFRIMKKWMTENKCFDYQKFYKWYCSQKSGNWTSGNKIEGQAAKLEGDLRFPRPEKRLPTKVIGYSSCSCKAGYRPGVVLDPFVGSGTTCVVARKLGRNFIGIDFNPFYVKMANKRLSMSRTRTRDDVQRTPSDKLHQASPTSEAFQELEN